MEKMTVPRSSGVAASNFLVSFVTLLILAAIDLSSVLLFSLSTTEFMVILLASAVMYLILLFVLASTSGNPRKSNAPAGSMNHMHSNGKPFLSSSKQMFVGSTQTKTYHLSSCRLAKSIKNKFKLSDSNPAFFKSKKFKACKICLNKKQ